MAEKPPEPDPNSSDLDNSPDSADFGHLGKRFKDVWIDDSAGHRFVAPKSVAVRDRTVDIGEGASARPLISAGGWSIVRGIGCKPGI